MPHERFFGFIVVVDKVESRGKGKGVRVMILLLLLLREGGE
jgi:hypothetical protein